MPRKLSELKQFVPQSSLKNIKENPAENSVLGNVKKLYDLLESENDYASKILRNDLGTILDAAEGKIEEGSGDLAIDLLHGKLHAVYLLKTGNGLDAGQDEEKKNELKNLIEYVAGGLGVEEGDILVDEEKRSDLEHMERTGRSQVRIEQTEAESAARWKAVEGKSGFDVLDEHKAAVNKLPKNIRGIRSEIEEAAAKQQLKTICIDILATRRAIEAKRNDKSGLKKAAVNADLVHTIKQDMIKSEGLNNFFNEMSYADLHKLAYEGHGGAMEDKISAYFKNAEAIPADAPYSYMPTAKERTELLQDMIPSSRHAPSSVQRKYYIELLATRAAVNSKRNDKASLNVKVNPAALEEERKKFEKEPLRSALIRATEIGEKQEKAYSAACSGHGGALEDLISLELRRMAVEKESGYKMQNVDTRFAPTFTERKNDLSMIADSKKFPLKDRLRAVLEIGVLDDVQEDYPGTKKIDKIESVNRQTDLQLATYAKVMDQKAMEDFIKDAAKNSSLTASENFEKSHAGQLRVVRATDQIEKKLADGANANELQDLAAKKMVLMHESAQFQQDKNDERLIGALEDGNLEKKAAKLLKSEAFQEMCSKLGPEKLAQQIKGSGAKLMESFSLAQEGKLEVKPEENAIGKGPKQNELQNGPVINM